MTLNNEPSQQPAAITFQSKTDQKMQKKIIKQEKKAKKQFNKIVTSLSEVEKANYEIAQKNLMNQRFDNILNFKLNLILISIGC